MVVVENLEGQESEGRETRQKPKWKETQKKHQANDVMGKFYRLKTHTHTHTVLEINITCEYQHKIFKY